MRNYGLAILGLIFVVSCSEEDPRIDISYTGAQLGSVKMPVGGIETGHLIINGDGSIHAFNIFGTPVSSSHETSLTFFSLYAVEEGAAAVVRTMGTGLLDDSAVGGEAGESSRGSKGSGSSRGSEGIDSSIGSESSGSSTGSEGLDSSRGLKASGSIRGSEGLDSSRGSEGSWSTIDSEGTEGSGEGMQIMEAASGFEEAVFHNAYPLMQVDLLDDEVPLQVRMSAWSPFIPLDIMDSNLPVAVFEWELTNPGKKPVSYSLALAMQNPPGLGGKNGRFSLDKFDITPKTVSGWKGFTFSNGKSNSSMPGTGMVRVISSAENTFFVPLIADSQKSLEQFWTDFSTDGKLELQSDIIGSSGRIESRSDKAMFSARQKYPVNEVRSLGKAESGTDSASSSGRIEPDSDPFSSSGRMKSRSDAAGSSGRMGKRDDDVIYSGSKPGMAALYSSGVLEPGESVTIPFLFSWFVPFVDTVEALSASDNQKKAAYQKTGIPFEDKALDTCAEEKLSAPYSDGKPSTSHSEDKPSTSSFDKMLSPYHSESKPSVFRFKGIDDNTGYMVTEYENLRDKTLQFSHAMITSTIAPEALETVLSGFANAVEQRDGNTIVISSPFPDKATNGISVADRSAWDIYHATSGFAYNEEEQVMKFSPETDVLPVRFFYATQSGWGTINVSRARIVLDCNYGSLNLKQLLLEGRSFFVFREFVPSREANTTYDNETLIINFPEIVHIPEGMSFTMEIP